MKWQGAKKVVSDSPQCNFTTAMRTRSANRSNDWTSLLFKGGIFSIWSIYACNFLRSPPNLDWRISLASLYSGSETPKPLMASRAVHVRLCLNLAIFLFVGSSPWSTRLRNISQKSSNLLFSPLNTGTFKGLSHWLQLPE